MKKVELLAPAGSYESFLGAIHAGADAIYLGGVKYGARAFAENFDEESLCRAIYYAHLFERKVYLTLNTLMKQSELEEVEAFLTPFYDAGLDGVIVQDLGLLSFLKRTFPLLELHISTQMAITGPYGVRWLKELGAVRVVPARELSLKEIQILKAEGLEIETFIHGAMCYSYSGQCFFSSFLGGRSGNRGKCAQSCRLPYQVVLEGKEKSKSAKEEYPLSLKDMCSVKLIPELLKAGIDSFKIEGRMKRPEYVAGVTSIYRKYIDICYQNGMKEISIENADWEALRSLYIRTDIQDGYYKRYNGKEMVTIQKPSYSGIDEDYASSIYEKYVKHPLKAEVCGFATLKKGQPICLQLFFKDVTVSLEGDMVEQAQKRPILKEDVTKQLQKTGNTDFIFSSLELDMEEDIFISVKSLNELRRQAFELLEKEIKYKSEVVRKESRIQNITQSFYEQETTKVKKEKSLHVVVASYEQCKITMENPLVKRIYVSSDLLLNKYDQLVDLFKEASEKKEIWIKASEILREKDFDNLERLLKLSTNIFKGFLVSNIETYSYLKYHNYNGKIGLNYHVYMWNQEAKEFWKDKIDNFLMPVECNIHEWKQLQDEKAEYLCYGRIPMMVTANCIRKTKGQCRGNGVSYKDYITDRYQAKFFIQTNCNYCYNVVYNSVPNSLHQYLENIKELKGQAYRLDFTTESENETVQILNAYASFIENDKGDFGFLKEYTTGHYKKGAL
ncbi:MAG: U32 family peptidase [Lachnospiraceae bacterium]|nr:U32 family peptidase [Lachnospiraceae bacterium]